MPPFFVNKMNKIIKIDFISLILKSLTIFALLGKLKETNEGVAVVLAFMGFLMIIVFMFLIMTKRLSAMIALMVVPVIFAVIGGFWKGIGKMAIDGVTSVAPTGIMILFAILYFGLMIDAGLFDPVISQILKLVKGDRSKLQSGQRS